MHVEDPDVKEKAPRKASDKSEHALLDLMIRKSSSNLLLNSDKSHSSLSGESALQLSVQELGTHTGPVLCMDRSEEELVTAGGDKIINVFNMKTMENTHNLKGHTDTISTIIFDKESNTVVSGSHDRTLRVWKLHRSLNFWEKKGAKLGSKHASLTGHNGSILCSDKVHGPTLQSVITGSYDHTLRVWNLSSLKCDFILEGHTQPVTCISTATHKPSAVSGGRDDEVRLWNIVTGTCTHAFLGHGGIINDVHIDKDRIVSCSNDGTVKVQNFLCLLNH
jgi:WD40 repeat protein